MQDVVDRVKAKMEIETAAKRRYDMGGPGAAVRATRFRDAIKLYAPLSNDQWPEDKFLRPGKVHITANLIRAYCDITARLLSLPPRIINKPPTQDLESRKRAEAIEQLFYRILDDTGWDVWMVDWNLSGEVFGIKVLKPFWNNETKEPDVQVVEQPQNLMIGWGSNDFSVKDWTIYRYTISFMEAKQRWPDTVAMTEKGAAVAGVLVDWSTADKSDIVDQKGHPASEDSAGGTVDLSLSTTRSHLETYEYTQHLEVWDYWYKDVDETGASRIMNAILLGGRIVDGPNEHPELPVIPYEVTESGHEPGSPEGMGTVELLRDVQMGYNRALSLWTQYVLDNSGTAYQVKGPNAGDMPEGVIPKSDEYLPVGENSIEPIQRNQNTFPINQLVDHFWELASRLTGIPQVLFGQLSGAQTSGRATAVQVETALNRLDPKRKREYQSLRNLMRIWGFMLSYKNANVPVAVAVPSADPSQAPTIETQQKGMKELLAGFDHWKIVAPEITPRDDIEATQNAINKVNAHLSSLESAMDEIGVDNPQHELDLIRQELSDARINPGQVQAFVSALQLMMATAQQQAAQQAPPGGPEETGETGQNIQQAQNQQAQPGQFPDQNQPGVATAQGSPPPPGAPAPGGLQLQGMIQTGRRGIGAGQAQALGRVQLPDINVPIGRR